jgi:hypothetical protein
MIRAAILRWALKSLARPDGVYVSGPMTGMPNLNFPAFHRAAARLRADGHRVVNPAELATGMDADWHDCLRVDLIAMLHSCDRIALLPGWECSRGAVLEMHVATALGMRPIFLAQDA